MSAPASLFTVNSTISLSLVFMNAGANTLVLLRPKPEQLLSKGERNLRARIWKGASEPQWVLEPSIVYEIPRTLTKHYFVMLSPGDSLMYPVKFGRASLVESRASACGWDVLAVVETMRTSGHNRNNVLGECFREPGA